MAWKWGGRMKSKQLFHREAKFRKRFIAEYHYNKVEQQMLDEVVKNGNLSYSFVYKAVRKGTEYLFMTDIALRRLSRTIMNFCITITVAAKSFSNFAEDLQENELTTNIPNPNRWNETI